MQIRAISKMMSDRRDVGLFGNLFILHLTVYYRDHIVVDKQPWQFYDAGAAKVGAC